MRAILCFGDSITFGTGECPAVGWCGRLKNFFETEQPYNAVYNLGVPGHTSTDLLKRFEAECDGRLRLHRPENRYTVLIAIGTNDAKYTGAELVPKTELDRFEQNIHDLLAKACTRKAKIACLGLMPADERLTMPYEDTTFTNKRLEQFNAVLQAHCARAGVPFLDLHAMAKETEYVDLLDDGVHPNSAGYDFMLEQIKNFLDLNDLWP